MSTQILIIDDDPEVLRLTRTILEHAGHETFGELRGDRAMELLRARRFDLVCVDLMLPTVSGFELCEFIRATPHLQDMAVLMMSSRTLPLDRADALEAGADGYLAKPFSRHELLHAVDTVLDLRLRPAALMHFGARP